MRHAFVFLLVLFTGFGALADEVRFRLINGTSYPIRALVLSQSDLATWGPNVVSPPPIAPGAMREILVRGDIIECNVDLKVAFDTIDSQPIWKYLDLCNLRKIRLRFDQMSGITTASYEE